MLKVSFPSHGSKLILIQCAITCSNKNIQFPAEMFRVLGYLKYRSQHQPLMAAIPSEEGRAVLAARSKAAGGTVPLAEGSLVVGKHTLNGLWGKVSPVHSSGVSCSGCCLLFFSSGESLRLWYLAGWAVQLSRARCSWEVGENTGLRHFNEHGLFVLLHNKNLLEIQCL